MAPEYVSDALTLRIETPLGKDALILNEFEGAEKMSGLFSFTLLCHSADAAVNPYDLVGKDVGFAVQSHDASWRDFHGIVTGFAPIADGSGQPLYRLRVAPRLWRLTLSSDNRIYQDKDVKEILADVFNRHGVVHDVSGLSRAYEKREYCVQYKETAFNFVSRLMEDEGIFYWFKHEPGKHTLMLGDSVAAYQQAADAEVAYRTDPQNASGEALITAWEREHSFTARTFVASDYDYAKPDVSLENQITAEDGCDRMDDLEMYHFPAMRKTPAAVKTKAENERDAYLAVTDVATGGSHCRSFAPGLFFTLGDAPYETDKGQDFVLTAVSHKAHGSRQKVGTEKRQNPAYANTFTCIPKDRVARPLKQTPVPKVNGVETAEVTGPEGEDVYTDKLGRVKVHFMWDRENTPDDQCSCWVRVMHNQVGGRSVPEIGQEVIVSFEHGSPDRPIITGAVYNEIKNIESSDSREKEEVWNFWERMLDMDWDWDEFAENFKFDVEDRAAAFVKKKVKKSKWTKRGKSKLASMADKMLKYKGLSLLIPKETTVHERLNYLKFRELPGAELVDLFAKKDFKIAVENDFDVAYTKNTNITAGDAFNVTAGNIAIDTSNEFGVIAKDAKIAIKNDIETLVKGEFFLKNEKGSTWLVNGDCASVIGNNLLQHIEKDRQIQINGNSDIKIEGKFEQEVKEECKTKAKSILFEADSKITLKVGKSELEISASGITIKTPKIAIKADAAAEMKAPKVDVKADAMLTLDGGVVMIG